ncbi:PAS domain-containing sensor histidine kinase [Coralliovum pocilloporae]|uniref:PAS domain-containing sensor histidine kinase n=1 Tax=Coralliovum pocilloporae TaxID=3066369 RepID=UPI0033079DCF
MTEPDMLIDPRLGSVLDTAVDGIVVIDQIGSILMFNKACEILFGYQADEVLGKNVKCLMPPVFSREHDHYISHYQETGEKKIIGIGREVQGQHKDGTIFPLELSVGEANVEGGRQYIGIIRDLRPRKEAEDKLEELQAKLVHMARVSALDEMGAAIAHEVNQPLTALLLYLQALNRAIDQREGSLPENGAEILQKAEREARRAGGIVDRLRRFGERHKPGWERVAPITLMEDALELILIGKRAGDITIIRDYEATLPEVAVDPVQIQQVLVNILRNAVDALRDRPERRIRLKISRLDRMLGIRIEDTGPGISEAVRADLFKTFATGGKGMGLGLAISRSIAQNHGGDLTIVDSEVENGAAFLLQIPVGQEADQP